MLVFFIKYNYCLIWAALGILMFLIMLGRRESLEKGVGNVFLLCGGHGSRSGTDGDVSAGDGKFQRFHGNLCAVQSSLRGGHRYS